MRRIEIAAVLFLSASLITAAPASAVVPGSNGRIAYWNFGKDQVFSIAADGTDRQQLTNSTKRGAGLPVWSPDGTQIAYVTDKPHRGNRPGLSIMNANGSGQAVILAPQSAYFTILRVSWSPDGAQLAFCALLASTFQEHIFVIGSDGSGLTKITPNSEQDCDPQWSPDGTKIAFTRRTSSSRPVKIATMNPDGSGITNVITPPTKHSYFPTWSPDGSQLAFIAGFFSADVMVAPSDGSGSPTPVTDTPSRQELSVAWSPDGTKLLFSRTTTKSAFSPEELWTCAPDGSSPARLTSTSGDEYAPDWQSI